VHASQESDEADRLRRLSAVIRFLGHIRESVDERELVLSLIQAGAVWYDLDARAYRRQLNGRFVLEAWLPGADVTHDPREIDVDAVLKPAEPTHLSSINDLEQYGWQSAQGEQLLLPIAFAEVVRRILVLAGPVERDVEDTMMVVCRSAGTVLETLAERRGVEVRDRLLRRIGASTDSLRSSARAVVDEYLDAVGAAAARVTTRRPSQPTATLYSTGGQMWTGEEVRQLEPGAVGLSARRIAIGFALGSGASGVIDLLASPARPFTVERAQDAMIGSEVLGAWLAGMSLGATLSPAQALPKEPEPPPFEETMRQELDKARRLSLSGGVLVASVRGSEVPDPRVVSAVIRTVRAELRSADLMGQLSGGDIAAVLVRTGSEGVAKAADRVRVRLEALSRARQLPAVIVGHALYESGAGESPTALVARARREAGLVFS
jgi:hypothetical protein